MKIPAYVINLDHAQDRLVDLSTADFGSNISLKRIPAIYGKTIPTDDWQNYDKIAFESINGRPALPGEYGCYQSHLAALRTFLEGGERYGLILEDDIAPDSKIADRVNAIIDALPELQVVKLLNHRTRFFMKLIKTKSGDELGRTVFGPQGSAAAYLVSRQAATKLVYELAIMRRPWDVALERFWDTGVSVFSTRDNVVDLSEHAATSNITGVTTYREILFPFHKLLAAWATQIKDGFVRAHYTLLAPKEYQATRNTPNKLPNYAEETPTNNKSKLLDNIWQAIFAVAVLLFVSSVWVESDMYRYAGAGMVLVAFVHYFRVDFRTYSKPLIGWPGILCILWAVYVAARMTYSTLKYPELGIGASEGIYILPIVYATLGYAFFLHVKRPFLICMLFIFISLFVLFGWSDFDNIAKGKHAVTFLQNNTIHASVSFGFILICSIFFGIKLHSSNYKSKVVYLFWLFVVTLISSLSLLDIYSLQSKGVWLALVVTMILLSVLIATRKPSLKLLLISVGILMLCIVLYFEVRNQVALVAGPTAHTTVKFFEHIMAGRGIRNSMDMAIFDPDTPSNARERLLLWASAIDIWSNHLLNGAGIGWLNEWQNRTYKETNLTLLHNGYLEVAVRYGIIGLLFYATLFWWSIRIVRFASQKSLVEPIVASLYVAALIYFLITIMSNSNNRLAIGESFVWFFVSLAFYHYFQLQKYGLIKVNTYL